MSQKRKDIPGIGYWALLAWWQELFCVVEELETIPPDLFSEDFYLNKQNYPDVGKASITNTGGVLLYRLISDRQDPEQLRKVVVSRISQYAKQHPDVDLEFHILNENAKLNDCKNDLFNNMERNVDHYNKWKIIDQYVEVRDSIVKTSRPQTNPPQGWDQVFAGINDYLKFDYLNLNYPNKKKVRWSHIYYAMTQDEIINQREFFRWIQKHFDESMSSDRPQPNTKTDPRINAILADFTTVE